jgi:hypothetical protein
MTEMAAAFPSTSRPRVIEMPIRNGAHPTVIRWVDRWLSGLVIETWINAKMAGRRETDCGVPQGSPCSPVLFALILAGALKKLPDGVSYVDDCSWVINFASQREFKQRARVLLDLVHATVREPGFTVDGAKTRVAWIFAGSKPSAASRKKATEWRLRWTVPDSDKVIERRFNFKAKPI